MKKAVLLIVMGIMINAFLIAGNYSGGDGASPETAYQIATTADLLELSHSPTDWSSYFIQVADVIFGPDETQTDWDGDGNLEHPGDDALGFSSIGNINNKFTGSYNGQGYSIEGLYISRNSGTYIGLFGWINGNEGCVIGNINLVDVEISGMKYIGGLVGICMESDVNNCCVSGNISGDDDYVGGLIGYSIGNSNISLCHTSCNIEGYSLTGGLVGFLKDPGIMNNCSATCTIEAIEGEVGGLIGQNLGQVNNSFAVGSVYGPFLSGGLIGINEGMVNNCYAGADASGTIMVGGLVGSNEAGEINKCYSNGLVAGQYYVGGLVGDNSSGIIANSFWDIYTSGNSSSGGGTGKTSQQMKSIETYTNSETEGLTEPWDFIGYPFDDSGTGDNWNIVNDLLNDGYPYFSWQDSSSTPIVLTHEAANISSTTADLGGTITSDGGSPVTMRGVVYSLTNSFPTIGGEDVLEEENGTGSGIFTETIHELDCGSSYYYRAYAANILGIAYGQVMILNTDYEMIIWKGYEDENWNNPANWSSEMVPESTDHVAIPFMPESLSNPVIGPNQTADCYNLLIENGGNLTIQSTADGTGSLITSGEIENQGTFNIQRYIRDDALHLISIPVQGETAETFLGDYLLQWDETDHQWINIVNPQEELNYINGYGLQPASGAPKSYTFQGTPASGSISHSVSFTEYSNDPDANEGANLLGNPYPSSIDWSKLNDTWGAIYYWNPETECYATWNNGQATNGGSQYVPPMQGFFIVASEPSTITFDDSVRTHEGAGEFYKSQSGIGPNSILLETLDKDKSDELLISFNGSCSGGFDLCHDAFKFFSETPGSPEIYTINTSKKFSIDVRPESNTIQLGFKNEIPGIFSIGIKDISDVEYVYIEDTKSGKYHDLLYSAYDFIWDPEMDNETRFVLHLKDLDIPTSDPNESGIEIYSCENCIYINGVEQGEMQVYDMMSRIVFRESLSGPGLLAIPVGLKEGVYIVRVSTETNVIETKSIYIKHW